MLKFTVLNQPSQSNSKGFTLIELLVASFVSLIVGALVLQAFVGASRDAIQDRKKVLDQVVLKGVLDEIGKNIKLAGEHIPEDSFPVISFTDIPANSNSYSNGDIWLGTQYSGISTTVVSDTNSLTIRRSILQPLTLCQNIPAGGNVGTADGTAVRSYPLGVMTDYPSTIIKVATGDLNFPDPSCRATPINNLPGLQILTQSLRNLREWRCKNSYRGNATLPGDSCDEVHQGSGSGYGIGKSAKLIISNRSGSYNNFVSYNEFLSSQDFFLVGTASDVQTGILATASSSYKIGDPIYVVEERKYSLDSNGDLNLYINGIKEITIASGIAKFKVSAKIYDNRNEKTIAAHPNNECSVDAGYTCNFSADIGDQWKDIASIKIEIQKQYDATGGNPIPTSDDLNKITSTAEFSAINN
jgi:prepilin-type N-terminal cleavage/methylation domain-containing protein